MDERRGKGGEELLVIGYLLLGRRGEMINGDWL
jgi:hypothetical protein